MSFSVIKCQLPAISENTFLTNPTPENKYNPGDDAFFECAPGNTFFTEHTSVYCQQDGTWDRSIPTCDPQKCSLPVPAISDGSYINNENLNEFSVGHILSYVCDFGYTLSDSGPNPLGQISCLPSGKWEENLPECVIVTCPEPKNIEHGSYEAPEGLEFLSTLIYSCDKGYEISGDEVIECYEDGAWSAEPPECIAVRCGRPEDILHGSFTGDGNYEYKSIVEYRCNLGYNLIGDDELTCEAEARWNGPAPVCKPVSCGKPDPIDNGVYKGRDFTLNNVIRYECDAGYQLSGTEERVCRETGNWQGEEPTCIRIQCERPPTVVNGFFIDATFYFEDSVTYQCDDGYRLSGEATLTCLSSGGWSPLPPTCESIVCSVPPRVDNAFILNPLLSGSYSIGQRIQYQCDIGYEFSLNSLNPLGIIECDNTGQWEANLPECVLITCSQPLPILNGEFQIDGIVYNSTVNYSCFEGYELVGDSKLTCASDGSWAGVLPVCNAITCDPPDFILNGLIDYKDLKLGSVIRYMCNEGYELSGQEVRRCVANLSYSGEKPVCEPVRCNEPDDLEHGTKTVEGYEFQSTVSYKCDKGYILQGDRVRTCTKDKVWNGQAPICDIVQCDKPSDIISNGRMIGTNFTYGSVVEYVCDEGYLLDGLSNERTCLASGQWDTPIPICIAVECPRLSLRNGFTSSFQREYGTTVTLSCKPGYRLQGSEERTCQQSGFWSGETTLCVKYSCPRLEAPVNGQVLVQGNVATYQCLEGFTLVGESRRTCEENGWSAADPVCEANACEDITQGGFPNGEMTFDDLVYGSYITFICNTGFVLEGDRNLECYADGTWSGAVPFCRKIKCFPPFTPHSSSIIGDDFSFNSSITYQCDEGYRISGNAERVCQADGSWSGKGPSCIPIICPVPQPNPNVIITGNQYTYGAEIQFLCNSGYKLQGPSSHTCTEEGEWSGEDPVCIRTDCQSPPRLDNGRIYPTGLTPGSIVIYECDEGYDLVGDATRSCMDTAEWSGTDPYCDKVSCGPPPPLDNGYVTGSDYFFEDVIEYRCDQGFTLAGANTRVCLSIGRWGGADPTCTRISCGPVKVPDGVIFNLPDGTDEGTFEARAALTCEEGYQGVGTNYQVCQANGRWSDLNFYCEIVTCDEFNSIRNGRVIGSSFDYGSLLQLQCDDGYRLIGNRNITCLPNGDWNYEVEPYCEEITCPDPTPLNNGDFTLIGSGINAVITFRCDEGYRLHGTNRKACQKDGSWSGADPYCRLVICNTPPVVENSRPFDSVSQYLYNFEARYVCDKGFEISSGDRTLTCSKSGEWTGVVPMCSRISCGEPSSITHGLISVSSDKYEGSAEYSCEEGFRLKGTPTVTCDETGSWAGSIPKCVAINCGPPPSVLNSLVIDTKQHTFNSIVTYICDRGYRMIGSQSSTCLATGVWSGPKPFCAPISCGEPPEIAFAVHTEGNYEYKTRITYTCIDGYEITGNPTLECIYNGAWSGERPVCHQVDCGPPPVLQHSSTTLPNGPGIGNDAVFECNDGYYLVGSSKARCTEGKTWEYDDESPNCLPVECGAPDKIDFGTLLYKSSTFGSVATLTCDEGYTMRGTGLLRCTADGSWRGEVSSCEPVNCGLPPSGGQLTFTASGYTYGSRVEFSCNKGYKLVGPNTATCTNSGKWSEESPQCLRISCTPLELPDNGLTLNGDIGFDTYYGDRINLGCDEGFIMIGTGELECLETGLWSSDPPVCQPEPESLICNEDTGISHTRPVTDDLYAGAITTLDCEVGYKAVGNLLVTCNEDGTWTPPTGKCTRVFCGKPRLRDFVNVVRIRGNSFFYGDQISFRCRAGVAPSRFPAVVTCREDGQWDGDIACGVTCKQPCQHGGICLGLNRCKCPTGYGGRLCEKAICILPCLNGGKCISPYKCSCPSGYTGVRCNKAVCNKTCANGGKCLRPNKCKCAHGYGGRFCDKTFR